MTTNVWETVRVFISSTFSDMHAERDHLVKVVFPELRRRLEKHRIHLVDIDLRWGVTKEQADNDMALDLCLQQVDECRPFFIGILGERYGYIPSQIPSVNRPEFGWVQGMTGKSITELEIIHGVLNDHEMQSRSFFHFRDPDFIDDVPISKRNEVLSAGGQSARQLAELKETILKAGVPVQLNYPCVYRGLKINWRLARQKLNEQDRQQLEAIASDNIIDPQEYQSLSGNLQEFIDQESVVSLGGLKQFGDSVRDQLWRSICSQYGLEDQQITKSESGLDPLKLEADYHRRFMESRLRVYVGREQIERELTRYAEGDETVPCLLSGPSGLGKSAAMAKFTTSFEQRHKDNLVIPHFIGASPSSTGLRQMLLRFCSILKRAFSFEEEISQDTNSLSILFRQFITQIPENRHVLFVLDALNQLDEADNAHTLNWMPWKLPSHVKIIASYIDDPDRQETVLKTIRQRGCIELRLKPLTDEERFEIVRQVPSLSAKTLDAEQVDLLLENPATTNPLYLLVALEELRGFGSFEELNECIKSFPREGETVSALFQQVIERLETEFGNELVRRVFTLIATARNGLSESELLALTGNDRQSENLFPVLGQSRPYLQSRGNLIDFFHRGLYKAVRKMYLSTEEQQVSAHRCLAAYFQIQLNPPNAEPWSGDSPRALAELPYHQTMSNSWDELDKTLCNLRFIQAKCSADLTYDLVRDYSVALDALPELKEVREKECRRHQRLRKYGADLISYARANGEGISLPKAPDTSETTEKMRRANEALTHHGIDETRDARLQAFADFVSTFGHMISRFPNQTVPIAVNYGNDLSVVEAAAKDPCLSINSWLQRIPRPATAKGRPACVFVLRGHETKVTSVAMPYDGSIAFSCDESGTLLLWNLLSGELMRVIHDHRRLSKPRQWGVFGRNNCVAISADGMIGVSVRNRCVEAWDLTSGDLLSTCEEIQPGIESIALTPDGKTAIAAGSEIYVWDTRTGVLHTKMAGHDRKVHEVFISPCGKQVASLGADNTLRIWDVKTKKSRVERLTTKLTDSVETFAVTPDFSRFVWNFRSDQTSIDSTFVVWDADFPDPVRKNGLLARIRSGMNMKQPRSLIEMPNAHHWFIYKLAISDDGLIAWSMGSDHALRVWDIPSQKLLGKLNGHSGGIIDIAATPDGANAVTASEDRTLRVWDLRNGAIDAGNVAHDRGIVSISLSNDRTLACSGGKDGVLRIWNTETGGLKAMFRVNDDSTYVGGEFASNNRLVSGGSDRRLHVWDIEREQQVRTIETGGHLLHLCDGNIALAKTSDLLRVCDLSDGSLIREFQVSGVKGVMLADERSWVTIGGRTEFLEPQMAFQKEKEFTYHVKLNVWDIETGTLAATANMTEHRGGSRCLSASRTGDSLVVGMANGKVEMWDLGPADYSHRQNPELIHTIDVHNGDVRKLVLTGCGRTLYSASDDGSIGIVDLQKGKVLGSLDGHELEVTDIALTPSERLLISASKDATLRIWNLDTGVCLAIYPMNAACTTLVIVNEHRLIAGTEDGEMHFLNLHITNSDKNDHSDVLQLESTYEPVFQAKVEAVSPSKKTIPKVSDDHDVSAQKIDKGAQELLGRLENVLGEADGTFTHNLEVNTPSQAETPQDQKDVLVSILGASVCGCIITWLMSYGTDLSSLLRYLAAIVAAIGTVTGSIIPLAIRNANVQLNSHHAAVGCLVIVAGFSFASNVIQSFFPWWIALPIWILLSIPVCFLVTIISRKFFVKD